MPTPRITVGLPVYKGAALIGKALDCLQRQTFTDFEVIISVDGGDEDTAAACKPFLSDSRFRMIVHSERLDWVGNFNWLLQQDLSEFFCYRQHDDTTAPNFFEVLLQAADKHRDAAAIYCDCQYCGAMALNEIRPSIKGNPLDRVFQYIDRASAVPLRGLIRTPAIRQAGQVRKDEFRAPWQVYGWLARLLHWGSFKRVAKTNYYRLAHRDSFSSDYARQTADRKRAAWPTMFTALLDAAMPLCHTRQERLFLQQAILDQVVARSPVPVSIAQFMDRLRHEKNSHLLTAHELSLILRGQERRIREIKICERSRILRAIYELRRRYRADRIINSRSRLRSIAYQFRYLAEMWPRLMSIVRWQFQRRRLADRNGTEPEAAR
jgi:glycosyltransferase involved in cell wall biosynthesis